MVKEFENRIDELKDDMKKCLGLLIKGIYLHEHNGTEPNFANGEEYEINVHNLDVCYSADVGAIIEEFEINKLRFTLDENVFVVDNIDDEIPFDEIITEECLVILETISEYWDKLNETK